MPIHVVQNTELPVVEIYFTGEIDKSDLFSCADEVLTLLAAKGISRVLADCSAITEGRHTDLDLFELADLVMRNRAELPLKEAIIIPEDHVISSDIDFWQTTCQFRNIRVRRFPDRQSAVDWLLLEHRR